jgi:serine/alanine adding enzyme
MTTSIVTTTVELLAPGAEAEWDAFVNAAPDSTPYHAAIWRRLVQEVFGHEGYYLLARNLQREIVGVLPMVRLKSRLFGDYCVSLPYVNYGGAIASSTDAAEVLMQKAADIAAELGSRHVEFRDTQRRAEQWPVRTDKVIMQLDLPDSSDALWLRFEPKLRAQIRRSGKEGAETAVGGIELLPEFYRVFAHNMRDLGTPVYPRRFFARILEAYSGSSFVAVVRIQGRPVAAGLLLGFRQRLEIPWASSLREYNGLGVNMLLYWEVLKAAIARGYRQFDFGRSSIDSGTFRFKKQWGAQPRQLYWHYWVGQGHSIPQLNPGNPKYRLAIKLWQHLPLCIANRLGPLIVGNLP